MSTMPAALDRLQFAPPQPPGMVRAFGLAVIAHVLLMLALTWGINWNRDLLPVAAEAELWSAVPQEAAPKMVEPTAPPAPPPLPAPVPAPAPAPPPLAVTPEPTPQPAPREADIAIEREKEKRAEARRRQLVQEREERREAQRALAAQKKLDADRKLEAQRKLDLREKQDQAKAKAAQEKQKVETARRQRQAEEEKRIEAQRDDNLRRMQGLAGATGSPSATGAAPRPTGMSDSYPGRVRARVKPNIVFGEEIAGNPRADVEVRMSADGTIIGQRIIKSSGIRSWDEAVLKAVIKTEVLPRDVNGQVYPTLILEFRPKD